MHYKFPLITHINDVLPAIEGRDEFAVSDKGDYKVINYHVSFKNSFDMEGPDDVLGALRRECRGLKFYADGRIMARPYHKFFNVNEREETQSHLLNMSRPHVVMDKLDGSMIHPIVTGGRVRLSTKMGNTDIALDAEKLLSDLQWDWIMRALLHDHVTPIFEYVSPENKIVVSYEEPKLILTAIRYTYTGVYADLRGLINVPFVVADCSRNVHDIKSFIETQSGLRDREGDIIRFEDGHMLKMKNDWYVAIHKMKDTIQLDRNIVDLILKEQIDDARSKVEGSDLLRIDRVEKEFQEALERVEWRLLHLYSTATLKYQGDRKRVALELVPQLAVPADAAFIFKMLNGANVRDIVLDHCSKCVGNTTKYEEMMKWMKA